MRDGALQPVAVESGTIELSGRSLRIDLAIRADERTVPFPYNGTYRVRR